MVAKPGPGRSATYWMLAFSQTFRFLNRKARGAAKPLNQTKGPPPAAHHCDKRSGAVLWRIPPAA